MVSVRYDSQQVTLHLKSVYGIRRNKGYLLFAKGQMPRIDVHLFEFSEEELTRSSIVGVRTSEEERKLETLIGFHRAETSVIRSIVNDDYCIAPPAFPLFVKFEYQLTEEQVHHL